MKRKVIRIAAVILGVLVSVILILWIVGGVTSVAEAKVTISAPSEKVFAYLSESDKLKQ